MYKITYIICFIKGRHISPQKIEMNVAAIQLIFKFFVFQFSNITKPLRISIHFTTIYTFPVQYYKAIRDSTKHLGTLQAMTFVKKQLNIIQNY